MFEVYLYKAGARGYQNGVYFTLPAKDYEILDVLDKARVDRQDNYNFDITSCNKSDLLSFIPKDITLNALNHLARCLDRLDDWQRNCFEGLVMMDADKTDSAPIPIERLINMASSTDDCQIAFHVCDDKALGEFYLENGFYDDMLSGMSEDMIALLDTEKLGQRSRLAEGGVFTEGGYMVHSGELNRQYTDRITPTVQNPDYVFLLEIALMPDNNLPNGKDTIIVKLPYTKEKLQARLLELGTDTIEGCSFCRYESAIPQLSDVFGFLEDIDLLNTLAKTVSDLSLTQLRTFKAVLTASGCDSIESASILANCVDDYTLYSDIIDPVDAAYRYLKRLLPPENCNQICQFVSMHALGKRLLEGTENVLTDYGLVVRKDGGPIISPPIPEPELKMWL